jgi:uncharacterized protein with HEPN domain
MPYSADDLIRHILDEAAFLVAEASCMTEEQFMVDEKTQRAFARSFEIIGEAAKKVPDDFKKKAFDGEVESDGSHAG